MPFSIPWNLTSSRNTHKRKPSLDSQQPSTSFDGPSRETQRPNRVTSQLLKRGQTSKKASFTVTSRASSSRPSTSITGVTASASTSNDSTPAKAYATQVKSTDFYNDPAFSSDPRTHLYFVANPDPSEPSERPPPLKPSTRGNTILASVSSPLTPPQDSSQEAATSSAMLFGKPKNNAKQKSPVDVAVPEPTPGPSGISRVRTMPSKPSLSLAASGAAHKSHRSQDVRPGIDAVDVLDGTNPTGLQIHHDGPYEAIKKMHTPPNAGDSPTRLNPESKATRKPHTRTGFEVGEVVPLSFAYQLAPPPVHRRPEPPARDMLPPALRPSYRQTAPELSPPQTRFPHPEPFNPHRPPGSMPQRYSPPPNYEDAYGGMRSPRPQFDPRTQYHERATPAAPAEHSQQSPVHSSHFPAQAAPYQPPMQSQPSHQPPPMAHHYEARPGPGIEPHMPQSYKHRPEPNSRMYYSHQAPQSQSIPPQPSHRPRQLVMPPPLQQSQHTPFNGTAVSSAVMHRVPQSSEHPTYTGRPSDRNHLKRATMNQNYPAIPMALPAQQIEQNKKKKLTKKRVN